MARVAIIGAGYVGLTSAGCLSHLGHEVVCADIDADRVAALHRLELPIHEEGLDDLIRAGVESGRLRFIVGAEPAVAGADFVLLCLPTPQGADGAADLGFVMTAAAQIAPHLDPGAVVVTKSTVPVGSTHLVADVLDRDDVAVVSNPEFLREGSAVYDFLNPDRVVVGADDEGAARRVAGLYSSIDAPAVVTGPESAETIKYASNAFLALKLSYVNAIAALCEVVGADVDDVVAGMGHDERIGGSYLRPGPGWGGSCLPKDTQALLRISRDAGYDFELLAQVIAVNDDQLERVVDKARELVGGDLAGVNVGALGLAFKAGTDDTRESPAVRVIGRLLDEGAAVRCYDPVASVDLAGLELVGDPYAAVEGADVVVVLTEWDEFRTLDLAKVAGLVRHPRLLDTRALLDRAELAANGFEVGGIGRKA